MQELLRYRKEFCSTKENVNKVKLRCGLTNLVRFLLCLRSIFEPVV